LRGSLELFANERECHYFVDTKFRSSTHTLILCERNTRFLDFLLEMLNIAVR